SLEQEEVVSLPRGGLGGAARRDLGRRDVIDDDVRRVLLAPLLRVDRVEPAVVSRNEVAPLEDAQRLPRGARRNLARACGGGKGARGARGAGALHELAARESAARALHATHPPHIGTRAPIRRCASL